MPAFGKEGADGRARRPAFEHAGKNLHLVAFATLAHELRSAGATAIHVALQVGLREFEPWRTTVDDAAQRGDFNTVKADVEVLRREIESLEALTI